MVIGESDDPLYLGGRLFRGKMKDQIQNLDYSQTFEQWPVDTPRTLK